MKKKMKAKKGTKIRDRATTERALMDAAAQVFSERGYENSPTLEIARVAGCSEALIQRYFGGKEGLLLAVMKAGGLRKAQDEDLEQIAVLPRTTSLEKEVYQLFEYVLAQIRMRSPVMRIVLSRALVDPKFQQEFKKAAINQRRLEAFRERLEPFKSDGSIHSTMDIHFASEMLLSNFFQLGFMQSQIMGLSDQEVRAQARQFCAVFTRGMGGEAKPTRREK